MPGTYNQSFYQQSKNQDFERSGSFPAIDDLVVKFIKRFKIVGGSLGIVRDNEVHYLKGYGVARKVPEIVNFNYFTPSSVGSISKTITSLGILKLQERGFLKIEDRIGKYLPSLPGDWENISILDLLVHKSGLPKLPILNSLIDEEELKMKFPLYGDHPGINPRCAYYSYLSTKREFEIGKINYSNLGYCILGAIIDFITTKKENEFGGHEKGYEKFIYWNIGIRDSVQPNELMRTLCLNAYWRKDLIPNLALDFPFTGKTNSFFKERSIGWEGPESGWTMTVGDLSRLLILINTNKIISKSTKEIMMTNHGVFSNKWETGMGVFKPIPKIKKESYFDQVAFFNFGRLGNYDAGFTMWPDLGFGVSLLFNSRTNHDKMRLLISEISSKLIPSKGHQFNPIYLSEH